MSALSARLESSSGLVAADALLAARRGTAFFSRALGDLTDDDLARPVGRSGATRGHVVSYVGCHARVLSNLLGALREGSGGRQRWQPPGRDEVEFGATLPAAALRHLHAHAAVHLDVECRDLDPDHWSDAVDTERGKTSLIDLVWRRAGLVWTQGAALGITFGLDAIPAEFRWLTADEASDVGFGVAHKLTGHAATTPRPRYRPDEYRTSAIRSGAVIEPWET